MSTHVERKPRAHFTSQLEKLMARLGKCRTASAEGSSRYGRDYSTQTVTKIWLFGSYARGAETCGDLDVLVETRIDAGFNSWHNKIFTKIFGRPTGVTIHHGSPEMNSTRVEIAGALLIWSESDPVWRAKVAAITIDPSAGRYQRDYDQLPLSLRQIGHDFKGAKRLLAGVAAGHYQITTVEAAAITASKDYYKKDPDSVGREYRLRANQSLNWLASLGYRTHSVEPKYISKADGIMIAAGKHPQLPLRAIDKGYAKGFVLAPYPRRSEPDRLMLVTRTEQHPLHAVWAERKAWMRREMYPIGAFSDIASLTPLSGATLLCGSELLDESCRAQHVEWQRENDAQQ